MIWDGLCIYMRSISYILLRSKAIKTSDETTANVGSATGGIGYKFGWHF